MQDLHLVGYTTDRRGLIFSTREGSASGGFVVEVTDELLDVLEELGTDVEAVDGDDAGEDADGAAAEPADPLPERPTSTLPVREVQARLRAGESLEEVAAAAGVDAEWVARFAPPVIAERRRIVDRALDAHLLRARGGASAVPLRRAVAIGLAEKGVALTVAGFEQAWTSRLVGADRWVVSFTYGHRGRARTLTWELDDATGELTTSDRAASAIGWVSPEDRVAGSAGDAVDGLVGDPSGTVLDERDPSRRTSSSASRPARGRGAAGSTRSSKGSGSRTSSGTKAAATKKTATKKAAARKTAATKSASAKKKAAAKKAAAKKAAAKKAAAKKAAAKKVAAEKAAAKKKAAPKKAPAKKTPAKKTPAPRSASTEAPTDTAPAEAVATAEGATPETGAPEAPRAPGPTESRPSRQAAPGPADPPAAPAPTPGPDDVAPAGSTSGPTSTEPDEPVADGASPAGALRVRARSAPDDATSRDQARRERAARRSTSTVQFRSGAASPVRTADGAASGPPAAPVPAAADDAPSARRDAADAVTADDPGGPDREQDAPDLSSSAQGAAIPRRRRQLRAR